MVAKRHTLATARAPWSGPALPAEALRAVQEEAERLLCEGQAAAKQGCRTPAPFCRSKDYTDDNDNTAGQGRHAYEVTARYMLT